MVSVISPVALCAAALCALAALPQRAQALDKSLYGINYDLRQGPDWDPSKCKSASTIASDLKVLSAITKRVRTYALSDCDVRPVLTSAKALGMTVWLGVWVSADTAVYDKEVEVMKALLKEGLVDANVVGINVGSEAVYRGDITAEQAVDYITQFKKFMKENELTIPVAVTDIIDTMLAHPEIVEAGDVVTINQFPFWEKIKADKAAGQFKDRIQPLLELAGKKDVIISETGWSTGGQNENASAATAAGASRYLNDFVQLATAENWKYYYFQGFDSEYKAKLEGEEDTVEAYFGIFDSTGAMKPAYKDLKIGDLQTVSTDKTEKTLTPPKAGTNSTSKGDDEDEDPTSSASKGTDSTAETEDGPGKVSAGSTSGVSVPTASKNSTSKNSSTPTTAPKSAATASLLTAGLSVAAVVASAVLVGL